MPEMNESSLCGSGLKTIWDAPLKEKQLSGIMMANVKQDVIVDEK